jgi:metal-responsive CopG/Arc/MetJ family transcriptional regulator
MARAPAPKRKAAAKPAGKLRGKWYPVSILLPPDLVADVDAIAVKESRSRARTIEVALRQFVHSYRGRAAA